MCSQRLDEGTWRGDSITHLCLAVQTSANGFNASRLLFADLVDLVQQDDVGKFDLSGAGGEQRSASRVEMATTVQN